MDHMTVFFSNGHCHAKGQTSIGTTGIHSCEEQRFICHECHQTFSACKGTIFSRLRTSAEQTSP
jgi:transposase-like protein